MPRASKKQKQAQSAISRLPLEIIERILIETCREESSWALSAALVLPSFSSACIQTNLREMPTPTLYSIQETENFFKLLLASRDIVYIEPIWQAGKIFYPRIQSSEYSRENVEGRIIDFPSLKTTGECLHHMIQICRRHTPMQVVGLDHLEIDEVPDEARWHKYLSLDGISHLTIMNQRITERFIYKDCHPETLTSINVDAKTLQEWENDIELFLFYEYEYWTEVGREDDCYRATTPRGLKMPFINLTSEMEEGMPTIHLINMQSKKTGKKGYCKLTKMIKPKVETDYELYHFLYKEEGQK